MCIETWTGPSCAVVVSGQSRALELHAPLPYRPPALPAQTPQPWCSCLSLLPALPSSLLPYPPRHTDTPLLVGVQSCWGPTPQLTPQKTGFVFGRTSCEQQSVGRGGDALPEGREESECVDSALSFQALGTGSSSGHNLQIQPIFGCLTPLSCLGS